METIKTKHENQGFSQAFMFIEGHCAPWWRQDISKTQGKGTEVNNHSTNL